MPTRYFVLNWRIFVAAKSRDKALRLFRRIEEARGDGFRTTHHLRYFKDPSLWEAAANEPCRERTPGARLLFAFARAQMLGRGWHVGHVDIATGECDLTFDARHGSVSAFGSLVWVNVHLWPPGAKELGDDLPRTWLAVPSRPSGS